MSNTLSECAHYDDGTSDPENGMFTRRKGACLFNQRNWSPNVTPMRCAGCPDANTQRAREALTKSPPQETVEAIIERCVWQPIETAPKDGTWVDVWLLAPDGRHGKRVPNVKWDNNRSFNGGIARVAQPDAWVHAHGGPVWLNGSTITHWMPQPAEPALKPEQLTSTQESER